MRMIKSKTKLGALSAGLLGCLCFGGGDWLMMYGNPTFEGKLKWLTTEQQRKIHLEYGEKDFDLKLSKKSLPSYLPNVKPVIRKGYPHCGYMAAHTKEYVEELERFISK